MDKKYITSEKLKSFQESLGWLENVKLDFETLYLVGESLENFDAEKTALLTELRSLNTRRETIIKQLTK